MTAISYLYLNHRKLLTLSEVLKTEKDDKEVLSFDKKQTMLFMLGAVIVDFLSIWSVSVFAIQKESIPKVIFILLILQMVFITDIKLRIVPNLLVAIGFGFRLVLYIVEFFTSRDEFFNILKSDLIGFAFGFGFLLIVCLISRQAIGFGDVKLFGLIGITIGLQGTYMTLFIALVFSLIYGIVKIIKKQGNRKSQIPFGPFVFLGYLVVTFLSFY